LRVKFRLAVLAIGWVTAGAIGCTTTQKIVSGAAVGGGTGMVVAGPIGALAGAAIGGVALPVGSAALSAD
jgi:osmotically inducible lipoprotein OsmB